MASHGRPYFWLGPSSLTDCRQITWYFGIVEKLTRLMKNHRPCSDICLIMHAIDYIMFGPRPGAVAHLQNQSGYSAISHDVGRKCP